MSSSSATSSTENFPLLICSVCLESLVTEFSKESNVVYTVCGHVFHETCLRNSYKTENKGKRVWNQFSCPNCRHCTKRNYSKKLFLEWQVDHATMAIKKENKALYNEITELKKQLNVSELRLMMLEPNTKLSFNLRNLTWNDVTKQFQNELLKKIRLRFRWLNIPKQRDLSFLQSHTLMQIIQSEPNEILVLLNITDDYFDKQSSLNEYHSLDNFKYIFKNDLAGRLRLACDVPTLYLNQIPVTTRSLKLLTCMEHVQCGKVDKKILGKVAETYLNNLWDYHINVLCRVRIIQLISMQKNGKIEPQLPYEDQNILYFLERNGVLKRVNGRFDFAHDLIKFYITAIMVRLIMRTLTLTIEDARVFLFSKFDATNSLLEYCIWYLNNINEEESMDALKNARAFNEKEIDNMKLLIILAIMNMQNAYELSKVFEKFQVFLHAIGKTIYEIEYPCWIENKIKCLGLPHFAALRGNIFIFRELYTMFISKGLGRAFDYQELIHLCSSWTLSSKEDELREKAETVSFMMSLKSPGGIIPLGNTRYTPRTVHTMLIRHMIATGRFREVWNIEGMLYECMYLLKPSQFINILPAVYIPEEWIKIVEYYCRFRPNL